MDGTNKLQTIKSIKKIRNIRGKAQGGRREEEVEQINQSSEDNRTTRNAKNNKQRSSFRARQNGFNISRNGRPASNKNLRTSSVRRNSRNSSNRLGGSRVGTHLSNLVAERPSETGVVQRIDYEEAMPMLEPTVSHYGRTGEGMCVRGSEYITDVKCIPTTTDSPGALPTAQGMVLYTIPINPMFWVGSRIKKFYEMYRKYIVRDLVFELIPAVASTTAGALIGVCSYDPDDNPSLIADLDARMRTFMAMKGAKIWNVYSIGRIGFTDDGTVGWYFTGDGTETKFSTQGQFYIACASEVTPTVESSDFTLGQLIMHYDICFEDRILDSHDEGVYSSDFDLPSTALSTVFNTITANGPLSWSASFLVTRNIPHETNIIYIVTFIQEFSYSSGGVLTVNTETGVTRTWGSQGSVWYAFCDANDNMVFCDSLSDAVERHVGVFNTTTATMSVVIDLGRRVNVRAFATDYA